MYRRSLFIFSAIVSILLLSSCNSGPFAISGTLINGATGEPFEAGRVILCRKTGEHTCVISVGLAAEVGSGGAFNFEYVEADNYVFLYNPTGAIRAEWDLKTVDFTPDENTEAVLSTLNSNLGSSGTVAMCLSAGSMVFDASGNLNLVDTTGYMYYRGLELGLALVNDQPVTFTISSNAPLEAVAWSVREDECDAALNNLRASVEGSGGSASDNNDNLPTLAQPPANDTPTSIPPLELTVPPSETPMPRPTLPPTWTPRPAATP
jgi:hypothetical protein